MNGPPGFERHDLGDGHTFSMGRLPVALVLDSCCFDKLWAIHPAEFHEILMHGRPVRTPRWQQAFGMDYHSGATWPSVARSTPSLRRGDAAALVSPRGGCSAAPAGVIDLSWTRERDRNVLVPEHYTPIDDGGQ